MDMISVGVNKRPAFIPAPNGKYFKLNKCRVLEVECQHFSSRGGMKMHNATIIIDQTIRLTAVEIETVEDIFSNSIDSFSILELLKELEKRTKTDTY